MQKDKASHPQSPGRGPQHISLLDLGPKSRLARPRWPRTRVPSRPTPRARMQTPPRPTPLASGVSSVSPDPSRARAPTPLRLTRARLSTHDARTHDVTGAVIPIPQQGMVATVPTTLVTAASPLSLCSLTSFTVVYRLTVKGEWERLINITICYLFPLLT